MTVYMIYSPAACRYHLKVEAVWLFMHFNEATIYTDIEQVENTIEEYSAGHEDTLEIHTFKLTRIL